LFPESARPYLHGEIVGVGLLLQNHFNGEESENAALLDWMRRYGMPKSVTEIGVDPSDTIFESYCERLIASSAIDETNEDECRRLRASMRYLWSIR
jgi:glycerol dehydrogenase-like iron-containing ADH family enzyme